ncbi:MAG: hypothetical protein ABH864_06060 [archaeon]
MKKRLILSALLASFILISIVANVSAITGRLGNSRMVLNLDVGEEARRYVLVQNVNDVAITIELIASGDLIDSINFEDSSFILQPGEEKKAYFTIKADKAGTTETKVNVMFKPPQGSGVGLSANIIVVTSGESDEEDNSGQDTEDPEDSETDEGGFSFNPSGNAVQNGEPSTFSPVTLLAISTAILVIIFIILVIYSGRSSKKKRSGRPRE